MAAGKYPPPDYDSMADNEKAPLLGGEPAHYGGQRKMGRMMSCAIVLVFLCVLMLIATIVLGAILVSRINKNNNESPALEQKPSETLGSPINYVTFARKLPSLVTALPRWPDPSVSPLGVYYKAAVAAENGLCSEIGRDAMVKGGNAVDAIVATTLCMAIMNPQHSGLGGGHFMTLYDRTKKECFTIDARETAPSASTKDMYEGKKLLNPMIGWQAIAVPGELHGLWTAHKNYGRAQWRSLIEPTIDLLENGLPVSSALGDVLERSKRSIMQEPSLSILINNRTGDVYKAGEIMKRPVLAKTYRELANSDDPVTLFYSGSIAQQIAAEFQANGYPMTMQNSSTVDGNTEVYHKFIEAMKFAYAQRAQLGDMDFVQDAESIAEKLSQKDFVEKIRSMITEGTHPKSFYGPDQVPTADHGTTSITAMDGDGNAVSLTSSINLEFGSHRRSESTGIIWNDTMDDFSTSTKPNAFGIAPSSPNFIQPGKRPMSSMSPTIVFDQKSGNVKLAIGAAGGSKIISGIAYTAMRVLLFNETVKEALDKPRLHNQFSPDYTEFEAGFPQVYLDKLNLRGHKLQYGYSSISAVTAIERTSNGKVFANSDSRKGPASYTAGF